MIRRMAWIVLIAAAAAGGCLTGQGAVRGQDADGPAAVATDSPTAASR